MASKAKTKGDNEERVVVNLMREHGFACQRTLEAGARSDGSNTWDIDLYYKGVDNAPLIGECKCRESIGDWIWEYLGDNDFLTLRKNRRKRLYVLPEEVFLRLIRG
jgi:hypothetical protein